MLRVLVQNRPDTRENPGGDTVQMDRTVRYLRRLGHDVAVSFDLSPDLKGRDLVHLFNLTRPFETLAQAKNAQAHGKPYVLSSVYWDLEGAIPWRAHAFPSSLLRLSPEPFRTGFNRLRRCFRRAADDDVGAATASQDATTARASRDVAAAQAEIVRGARFVLPNSEAERRHLLERFTTARGDRIRVVLNGVSSVPATQERPPPDGGVFLCAGAIGPRKNQLHLVRAFRRLPRERLLVVGRTAPGCERYRRAVERAAGDNVEFRGPVAHEQMGKVLAGAKAVAQPSYIETPGLAAMEAAATGIPIVVSNVPPVREYFDALGHYCDPSSPRSIAAACRAAAAAGRSDGTAFARRLDWTRVLAPLGSIYAELAADVAAARA